MGEKYDGFCRASDFTGIVVGGGGHERDGVGAEIGALGAGFGIGSFGVEADTQSCFLSAGNGAEVSRFDLRAWRE